MTIRSQLSWNELYGLKQVGGGGGHCDFNRSLLQEGKNECFN